jgi:nucleotide-binding universal stress UspA family protein
VAQARWRVCPVTTRYPQHVTSPAPHTPLLRLVVGYDGSAPAGRALDAAVRLLQGRTGEIAVVYVAHIPSMAALSAGAVGELEQGFDEVDQELRVAAGEQLRDFAPSWSFERRQGLVTEELVAAAKDVAAAHPNDTIVIVVGSSSAFAHRMVGSVAVGLARHSPVPLVIVP